MGHYDECREGYCGICGQTIGNCEHTQQNKKREMNPENLLSLNRALIELDNEYEARAKEYKEYKDSYQAKRSEIQVRLNTLKHNINLDMFEHGQSLLSLEFPQHTNFTTGKREYSNIYKTLINAAEQDLSTGVRQLAHEYIGQKQYEGYDQRCDCPYGRHPTYGIIYQRIGLRNPGKTLSDYDIECCLYVLENIDVVLENLNKVANEGKR